MAVPNPLLLLEYDTRFAVFPEFRAYDYARPLAVPGLALAKVRGAVILVDPPYVNAECFEKTAQTVRAMSCDETKYIVSTGEFKFFPCFHFSGLWAGKLVMRAK